MQTVEVEHRKDGWWLIPDWDGEREKDLDIGLGPYEDEIVAGIASKDYRREMLRATRMGEDANTPYRDR